MLQQPTVRKEWQGIVLCKLNGYWSGISKSLCRVCLLKIARIIFMDLNRPVTTDRLQPEWKENQWQCCNSLRIRIPIGDSAAVILLLTTVYNVSYRRGIPSPDRLFALKFWVLSTPSSRSRPLWAYHLNIGRQDIVKTLPSTDSAASPTVKYRRKIEGGGFETLCCK